MMRVRAVFGAALLCLAVSCSAASRPDTATCAAEPMGRYEGIVHGDGASVVVHSDGVVFEIDDESTEMNRDEGYQVRRARLGREEVGRMLGASAETFPEATAGLEARVCGLVASRGGHRFVVLATKPREARIFELSEVDPPFVATLSAGSRTP